MKLVPCSCSQCAEAAEFFTLDGPQLAFMVGGLGFGEPAPLTSDAPAVAPADVSDLRRPIGSTRSRRHHTGTGATP